jgi:elongation factor Ts
MAEITASLVKELREKTGAGMMDCKKALVETNGDMRSRGRLAAQEGPVRRRQEGRPRRGRGPGRRGRRGHRGAVVEVNAETDFVAPQRAVPGLRRRGRRSSRWTNGGDIEALKAAPYPGRPRRAEKLTNLIATIGENMSLRRAKRSLSVSEGVVGGYVTTRCPRPGQDRRAGGARVDGDKAKLALSASRSPCMSPPPTRSR